MPTLDQTIAAVMAVMDRTQRYTPPSIDPAHHECDSGARGLDHIIAGHLDAARDLLGKLAFDVREEVDGVTGRPYVIALAERADKAPTPGLPRSEKAWGVYVFDRSRPVRYCFAVPHLTYEEHLEELALDLFRQLPGSMLALCNVHRTKNADVPGDATLRDYAATRQSIFHWLFTRSLGPRFIPQIQLHGFKDRVTDPPHEELVISTGAGRRTLPFGVRIADCVVAAGRTATRNWDGTADDDLDAEKNVQGIDANHDGRPWLHLEITASVRGRRQLWAPVTHAVARALLTPLTAFPLTNANPRCYQLVGGGSVQEVRWTGAAWQHDDVSALCGARMAAGWSPLAGFERVGDEPRVAYFDADGHLNELRYAELWQWADLSAIAGAPPAVPGSELAAFAIGDGAPRYYFLTADGHVHEIGWTDRWSHVDLTVLSGARRAAGGSALAGYQRVTNEPRVAYFDVAGHVNELRRSGPWYWADLTALSHAPSAVTGSGLAAFAIGAGDPRYYFQTPQGTIHEISWTGAWQHRDASGAAAARAGDLGSTLIGYRRVPDEPRVGYLDTDAHLRELRYAGHWDGADLTQLAGAPAAKTPTDLPAYSLGGAPRYHYVTPDGHTHRIAWSGGAWVHRDLSAAAGVT